MFGATAIAFSLDQIDRFPREISNPQLTYERIAQVPTSTFLFSDFKPEASLSFGAHFSPIRSVTATESMLLGKALLASTDEVDAGFLID